MRVVHLLHRVEERGNGIVNATVDLAVEQARSGVSVTVVSGGGEYLDLLAGHGVEHVEVDLHTRRPRALPRIVRDLRRALIDRAPDVVHAHTPTAVVLARLAAGHRFRLVTTAHNEFDRAAVALNLADTIIAVSAANAASRKFLRRRRVQVVRNGVIGSTRRRPGPAVDLERPSVVFVGGLSARKGVDTLIDAHEKVCTAGVRAHLHLVGDGPMRADLEERGRRSGAAEHLTFHGFRADPQPFLHQTDLFVLPSTDEPFGLVLAEAREAGCAILASRVGGIPEVLEGGRAGALLDVTGPGALAAAMVELLGSADRRHTLRVAARENLDWLSIRRVCEETLAVYAVSIET